MSDNPWSDPFHECGHQWEGNRTHKRLPGKHRCVKDAGHETDPTNDDHQCCCGEATE